MRKRILVVSIFVIIALWFSFAVSGDDHTVKRTYCPICQRDIPAGMNYCPYCSGASSGSGNSSSYGLLGGLFKAIFGPGKPQPPGRTPEERGSELNGIGIDLYNQDDFAGAERYFKKALRMHPKDPVIRRNIANSLHAQGNVALKENNLSKAAGLFEDALEYDPESQTIKEYLATALARMAKEADDRGDKRLAEKLLDKASSFDPNNQEIIAGLRLLWEYLGDQERLQEVRKTLTKMVGRFGSELEQANSSAAVAVVDSTFLDPNKPIPVQPRSSIASTKSALDEAATIVHETNEGQLPENAEVGPKPKGTKFFNQGEDAANGGAIDTASKTKDKASAVFENKAVKQSSGINPAEVLKNAGKKPAPPELPANLEKYKDDPDIQRWLKDNEQAEKDDQKFNAQLKAIEEDKKNGRNDPVLEAQIREQIRLAVSKKSADIINIKERVDYLQGLDLTKKPAKPKKKEPPPPASGTEQK
jgi:tetratricopeptide (TPR) repeat protein